MLGTPGIAWKWTCPAMLGNPGIALKWSATGGIRGTQGGYKGYPGGGYKGVPWGGGGGYFEDRVGSANLKNREFL